MKFRDRSGWAKLGIGVVIIFFMMACSWFSNLSPASTLTPTVSITPTPTTIGGGGPEVTPSPIVSACDGLSGELEVQILVGPADAAGLEPIAVGTIPFVIVSEGSAYLVQGNGAISYQATLEKEWGTYTVSFDMEGGLEGECKGEPGSEGLEISVEMSGEQMVEVRADGFQGDYPWSGTHELNLSFPLEDGATVEGEGWAFVLHFSP